MDLSELDDDSRKTNKPRCISRCCNFFFNLGMSKYGYTDMDTGMAIPSYANFSKVQPLLEYLEQIWLNNGGEA